VEGFFDGCGVAGDGSQIGTRRLIRLLSSLLPVAQGAKRYLIARREFFLGEPERPTLCPSARDRPHSGQPLIRQRLCISIGEGRGHDLRIRHRAQTRDIGVVFGWPRRCIGKHLDE
jgi:hypothetical protein